MRHDFLGAMLYALGRACAWLLLHALARPFLEGRDRVPRAGPLILVANHVSWVDPPLLAALLPRRLAFVAKEDLFHPRLWGWALRQAGMIPVRRGRAERQVLGEALSVLRAGGAIVVFPEGRRAMDGALLSAEPGVGLLAARSGAPLLPVALLGTERLRHLRDWPWRPPLLVRCGDLWRPTDAAHGSPAYRRLANDAMTRVAALLPPERRGPYRESAATPRASVAEPVAQAGHGAA